MLLSVIGTPLWRVVEKLFVVQKVRHLLFSLWNHRVHYHAHSSPYRMRLAYNLRPCMIRPLVISRMYSLQGLQSGLFASVVRSEGFLVLRAARPAHSHLPFFNDPNETFCIMQINRAIRT